MTPLVRRARTRDQLEGETILATFGLLFVLRGAATLAFTANNRYYDYLGEPLHHPRFHFCRQPRAGLRGRVRVRRRDLACSRRSPGSAPRCGRWRSIRSARELVGIDVRGLSALAFAGGGALVAAAGTLVSTFLSFNPSIGIEFTMKALVVVIMGGVGNMVGSLAAGVLLGVAEALCSYFVDSGLTLAVAYALFLAVLVVRPRGLFGTP